MLLSKYSLRESQARKQVKKSRYWICCLNQDPVSKYVLYMFYYNTCNIPLRRKTTARFLAYKDSAYAFNEPRNKRNNVWENRDDRDQAQHTQYTDLRIGNTHVC